MMYEFKLSIEREDNGFTVTKQEVGSSKINKAVFQDIDNDEFGEEEALRSVLYEVVEYFGCLGSKHDKKRIRIEMEENEF